MKAERSLLRTSAASCCPSIGLTVRVVCGKCEWLEKFEQWIFDMPDRRLLDPIFLMCSERSGSNLVTRIFGAHPDYFSTSPAHLFRVFSRYDPNKDLQRDILRLFDAKLGVWKVDELSEEEKTEIFDDCATTAEMIAALLNVEGQLRKRPSIFLKENSSHGFLPFMEQVSENPKYVFMVRDPRDMAASWVNAQTLRGGVVRSARRWVSDVAGALAAGSAGRDLVQITYEALVSKPEETLRRACEELGVAFHTTMLEHTRYNDGVKQDAERSNPWQNVSRDIMRGNFNKFQDKLSDDQIAYVEACCGTHMERFGYAPSRAAGACPFGSCNSFAELERALVAQEPREKSIYKELPRDQRKRLERWSSTKLELDALHGEDGPGGVPADSDAA